MSPDVLELIRATNPVVHLPDRDAPEARAVLLRARTAPSRRRRGIVRPAIAAAAATAAIAATVLAGGSIAPVSAREAVMAAAGRTAAFDSGQVTWRSDARTGDYRARAENVLRFDRDRTEMVSRSSEVLPGGKQLEHASTLRTVDGRAYLSEDGGAFRDFGPAKWAWVADRQRAEVSNEKLIALVREAEGVERTVDANGAAAYRATVPAAAFDEAQSGPPPAPVPLPAPVPAGEATLQLTLAADGTIRRLVVERPGQTQSFEWAELGEPQAIDAP